MTSFAATLPYPSLAPTTVELDGTTLRVGSTTANCATDALSIDLYGYPGFPPTGTAVRFGPLAIGARDVVLPDALAPSASITNDVAAFLERDVFLALVEAVAAARGAALLERAKAYRESPPHDDPARWQPVVPTRFALTSPYGVGGATPLSVGVMVIAAPVACLLAYAVHAVTASSLAGGVVAVATVLGAGAYLARSGSRAKGKTGDALFHETLAVEAGELVHRRGATETRRPLSAVTLALRYNRSPRSTIRYAVISIRGLGSGPLLVGMSDTRFAWKRDAEVIGTLPRWAWPCTWIELLRALDLEAELELRPDDWKQS